MRKIFLKLIACVFGIFMAAGAYASVPLPVGIGDFGTWATEPARELLIGNMTKDLDEFQSNFQQQLVEDYVPIEAKIGMAFMNAMSMVGKILETSLVRFMLIFIIIAYAFWVSLEAYRMINGTTQVQKAFEAIVKKGAMILVWAIVLNFGAAKIFMFIMGPIISVATYMSDFILSVTASYLNADLPDTCAAIHQYAATHASATGIIDANAAADLMCVPTRLSGFFYTGIAVGFKWMLIGLGTSAFTFLIGCAFVIMFVCCAWKFAVIALGVVADLFLGIFMLPFTALTETIGNTEYKGIVGDIFNGFLKLFSAESLKQQIGRFIKAAIYFVSLSIVVAVCMVMMSGVINMSLIEHIPSLNNTKYFSAMLIGILVWYLVTKAESIAKDLGGEIDASIGKRVKDDAVKLGKLAYGKYKSVRDLIKEARGGTNP